MSEQAMITELLKELRQDHMNNARTMGEFRGEVLSRIDALNERLNQSSQNDEKLHLRIDKKDERIRKLEVRQNGDSERINTLETQSRINRWWIATAIAFTVAVGTAMIVLLQKGGI